uniref:DNA replication ATP-dependent helicase/nuclease DNA2 n=1 Tax=Caenorhabditis tropicalis TaxID=1561998 RepID=A0A1I7T146_9PELO
MASRKRHISEENTPISDNTKRVKNDHKENTVDGDSDDSFENFCTSAVKVSPIKKFSPRSRSKRILLEETDDDDSFDSPVTSSKPGTDQKQTYFKRKWRGRFPLSFRYRKCTLFNG